MTVAPPTLAFVTTAYIQMLRTVTGFPIGDGDRPPDATDDKPYGIVHEILGGRWEGDAGHPESTACPVLQVTCAAQQRAQAGWLLDACRTATFKRGAAGFTNAIDAYTHGGATRSLAVNDHLRITDREFDSAGGTPLEGILFSKAERYRLYVNLI